MVLTLVTDTLMDSDAGANVENPCDLRKCQVDTLFTVGVTISEWEQETAPHPLC